jgi:hypothetical protein
MARTHGEMTAWNDGYNEGIKIERERLEDALDEASIIRGLPNTYSMAKLAVIAQLRHILLREVKCKD